MSKTVFEAPIVYAPYIPKILFEREVKWKFWMFAWLKDKTPSTEIVIDNVWYIRICGRFCMEFIGI